MRRIIPRRLICLTFAIATLFAAGGQASCNNNIQFQGVTAPPASLGLDPFYRKYVNALGLTIASSANVSDAALLEARDIVIQMTAGRPDLLTTLRDRGVHLAIIATNEVTTDIPEHSDLYTAFPGTDWNVRTRGVGATAERPVISVGEENLLGCAGNDRYGPDAATGQIGESILIHEFSHTILDVAINYLDPAFVDRVEATYTAAMMTGRWANLYADENYREYWAEGVQSWFDANREMNPQDLVHNYVNTRAELRAFDPELAALIEEIFGDGAWRHPYPDTINPACTPVIIFAPVIPTIP
jgi:hypothetical protein